MDWSDCNLVESIPGKVSGEPLFKGTRLPAATILDNVDAYLDDGFTLDEAIEATLESFPTVPNGAEGIRAILAFRNSADHQSVA